MPEPFKNLLGPQLVTDIALHIKRHYPEFDEASFTGEVNAKLDSLELKQRSDWITQQLGVFLPTDFALAGEILLAALGTPMNGDSLESKTDEQGIAGWAIMPLADYVACNGKQNHDFSMQLLREMTRRFSSEFAIRPFLHEETEATLAVVHQWAKDESEHVRRLASEGTRPRLPWGMRLQKFVQDPEPVIEVLEQLKDDPSEYVRRSVANNLNDIAKDHPDRVAEIAESWLSDASHERKKLVQHACRSLIKSGHKATLEALGYGKAKLSDCSLTPSDEQLIYGGSLQLNATLSSASDKVQQLMIDYVVHHQKANGSTTAKVFKWRSAQLEPGKKLTISKKHTIKPVTTRVYYPGIHKVELQVNGEVVAENEFELVMPES